LLIPVVPLSGQEMNQAIQELMNHLDHLLAGASPEQANIDWCPWLIVLAGAGAACEAGRRIVLDRLEDKSTSGPAL
jgi:hypothetical protein